MLKLAALLVGCCSVVRLMNELLSPCLRLWLCKKQIKKKQPDLKLLFLKQLLSCNTILKALWTLLFAFRFLLFEIGGNRELFHIYFKR
jgi:hypothetical protein